MRTDLRIVNTEPDVRGANDCATSEFGLRATIVSEGLPLDAEPWDDATIAGLSPKQLSEMTTDELVRVIRAARLPRSTTSGVNNLKFLDIRTLQRFVYLARRCCQNRMAHSQ